MPIDPSIITAAKPQVVNPLETVGTIQNLQTGLLNNRLLNQTVRGKEALGRIIGANTNADTGDVDWAGVGKAAAADPMASILMPQIQEANLARQRGMVGLDTDKLANWSAQLGLNEKEGVQLSHSLLPSVQAGMQNGPDGKPVGVTKDQAIGAVISAIQTGNFTQRPEFLARARNFIASMTDDPMQNLEQLKHITIALDPTQERIGQIYGTPGQVDTGDRVQPTMTPGLTGDVRQVGPGIPKNLSKTQLALTVMVIDPVTKEQKTTTLGALLGMPVTGGGDTPAASAPAPTATAPGAPAPAAPKPVAPIEAGGVVTGFAPGVKEAATTSANASAGTWQEDLRSAGGYAQRMQGLEKATQAIEKATTGPGAGKVYSWASVLDTFGIKHPTDVNSYAEANKYLQDYANQRGASLGLGTDAARAMVNAANPGVQTPKGAARHVLTVIKGLERMQAAQVAAAQADGVTPDKYTDWRAKWNRSVDPAAFSPPRLTKEEWEAKRKAMGSRWAAYEKGLNAGIAAGVITAADLRK